MVRNGSPAALLRPRVCRVRKRTGSALAGMAAVVTAVVGLLVLGLPLWAEPLSSEATDAATNTLFVVGMTVLTTTGALVVRTGSHQTMGWLLTVTGLANVTGRLWFALAVAAHEAGRDALSRQLGWFSNWGWVPGLGLALVLLLRFPDGRLVGAWRRRLERVVIAWTAATVLVTATVPGPLGATELEPLTNPWGLERLHAVLEASLTPVFLLMPVLSLLVAVATVLRWRRAEDRHQLAVVAVAVICLAVATALAAAADQASVAEGLAWLVLPGSVAYAIARHDLWDVDLHRRLDRLRRVREEERTRLQRDLHDSLGPLLGSITMRVEAARNLLAADDRERVDAVLASIGAQAEGAVVEVRRVLDELGPSALDDRDLVPALAELVESYAGGATRFLLRVDEPLPRLSSAAEVALYRVAGEALRNVVRHARARHCTVSIVARGESVDLVVTDDGVGLRDQPPGVGRRAMSHRISRLGGELVVTEPAGGGVRLTARVGTVAR